MYIYKVVLDFRAECVEIIIDHSYFWSTLSRSFDLMRLIFVEAKSILCSEHGNFLLKFKD